MISRLLVSFLILLKKYYNIFFEDELHKYVVFVSWCYPQYLSDANQKNGPVYVGIMSKALKHLKPRQIREHLHDIQHCCLSSLLACMQYSWNVITTDDKIIYHKYCTIRYCSCHMTQCNNNNNIHIYFVHTISTSFKSVIYIYIQSHTLPLSYSTMYLSSLLLVSVKLAILSNTIFLQILPLLCR